MPESDFLADIGALGAGIANDLAGDMGVTLEYVHRTDNPITLNAFLKSTLVKKEIVLATLSAGKSIDFFIPAQTNFPPVDAIALFDTINWTPPDTDVAIGLTVQSWRDLSSLGTLFVLTCYLPDPRQSGAVGMG